MLKRFSRFFQIEGGEQSAASNDLDLGPYVDLKHLMKLRYSAKTLLLPKARKVSKPQSGSHRSRFRGRGMEFSEVRLYQPGDDVRSIDWRVTARREKPHTKLYNEERERPVFIICDQSISQFFGSHLTFKSVRAAEVTALFAWTAIEHTDRVGGIIFSDHGHTEIKPARSRKTIMQMLHHAVAYNQQLIIGAQTPNRSFGLNEALAESVRIAKPGTLVVIVSDFHDLNDQSVKQLTMLGQHCELLLVRTYDPLENELPPPGNYPISNGSDTLVVNTSSKQHREDYLKWSEAQRQTLKEISTRLRSAYFEVSTADSPAHSLRSVLMSIGS